jgi:hypothetical protein
MPEEYAYAFVDFKPFRTQTPAYEEYFQMKGINHFSQPAIWTRIFDGIFYIKEMTPCGDAL